MRYFKILDENNNISIIGVGYDGIEISQEEYESILKEIQEENEYIYKLLEGTIELKDIPEKYQEAAKVALTNSKQEENK